jgi:1-deoxy-D-xylulose-5-phosphate reductoisomerase
VQNLTILGATGSIGVTTLDVVGRNSANFNVFALTGHNRIEELAKQCHKFKPRFAVVPTRESASRLAELVPEGTQVLSGNKALETVASHPETNVVVAAIVGAAGLLPTLAAVQAGKKVLLANKEVLVMAGRLFMEAVSKNCATLLPIDSEHNAIFQCLPESHRVKCVDSIVDVTKPGGGYDRPPMLGVKKLILSGSGGPFRKTAISDLSMMTPDQACAHPNWQMGRKISVDSATMMNKGLELIEACWLFNTQEERIDIVIHPESIVHSLVEYVDGSVMAQLGNPDMRTPIAHALAWPERMESGAAGLDLVVTATLNFEAPDIAKFPSLGLARAAAREMGDTPTALNAANEIAVAAFLTGKIMFTNIVKVVDRVMQKWSHSEPADLAEVQDADLRARSLAHEVMGNL